jgi:XisH protein
MARDRFHGAVRRALEKDGWRITADPYIVRFDHTAVEIDLAAEQLLAAERVGQKIAVEVKSFLGPSRIYDFHLALGQFLTYRLAIAQHEPERTLYLAIPVDAYEQIFLGPIAQQITSQYHVHVLVFDPIGEEVRIWGD